MLKKPEGCVGCPFYDDGFGFVPDELNPKAKVAFLAQNPGDTEESLSRPLIGRTGQMVQNDFAKYGFKREDASYLNIIKCRWRVPGQKSKTNVLPENGATHAAAKHCISAYLQENVKDINPNVTAVLGDLALYYGTGRSEVASWRGSVFIPDDGVLRGKKVVAMIHPAALYRDLSWRTAYKNDFMKIARESKSAAPMVMYDNNFRLGVSTAEFCDTLDALGNQRKLVALDIETSKHKPIEAKLKIIGIAWSKVDAMNYLWGVDDNYDSYVRDALSTFKGEFVTATPFDYSVLRHYGISFSWDRCHDLTLLHSRFDIELPHDVAFIASMFTNRPYWKWMGSIDPLNYNALDCAAEWEAFTNIAEYCQSRDANVWKIYNEDRRLLPVAVDLHLNGFPTDKKVIEEEREWYLKRRNVIETELLEAFKEKSPALEPPRCQKHPRYSGKSPLKVRKKEEGICESCACLEKFVKESRPLKLTQRKRLMTLLEKDGMKMLRDKESGEKSLAKGKVADLYKKYGDVRLLRLLDFWELDTTVTRYFKEGWITKATGRIHPTYSMHSAMHRWHCSGPNMQQQKKPEKEIVNAGV